LKRELGLFLLSLIDSLAYESDDKEYYVNQFERLSDGLSGLTLQDGLFGGKIE
jgi:hypothetical protein